MDEVSNALLSALGTVSAEENLHSNMPLAFNLMLEFLAEAFQRGMSQLLCSAQQEVCYVPRWPVATVTALLRDS